MRRTPHIATHPAALSLMAAALLSACGGDAGALPEVATVRDSADVRIVEIDVTAIPDRWTVAGEPTWSFQEVTTSGEVQPLSQLFDVTPLPDGRVLFGEYSTQSLLIGDPETGEFRRIGRNGDGPEEFRGPVSLELGDDGWITVIDRERQRIARVDTAGQFAEGLNLRNFRLVSPATASVGDELVVITQSVLSRGDEGIHQPSTPIARIGWDGSVDTIGEVLGAEYSTLPGLIGPVLLGGVPFSAKSSMGLWYGYSNHAEVSRWTPEGPDLIVRWGPERTRDTEAEAERARAVMLEAVPPEAHGELEPMLAIMPVSEGVGQFWGLTSTRSGGLWIGPYQVGAQPNRPAEDGVWLAIDSEGAPTARVDLPAGFSPSSAADDFVLGIFIDEYGVEHVQRREIHR